MSDPSATAGDSFSGNAETLSTEAGYDRWAKIYDAEDNPLVTVETLYFDLLLGDIEGLTVVDTGCGTGRHALRLAAAGARVTAVDFSQAMLAKARQKPGADKVNFVRHDLGTPFPLASGSFDRVVCGLVLDHISALENFFKELGRLCKPDGFILCSVMHPAMMLKGVQARFTDPDSGHRVHPLSYPNQISDYVTAVMRAGLRLNHISEHTVSEELAVASPRAAKYLGWPLLLLMRMAPEPPAPTLT